MNPVRRKASNGMNACMPAGRQGLMAVYLCAPARKREVRKRAAEIRRSEKRGAIVVTQGLHFVAPGKVEMREVGIPQPGPDEILVEIKACGLCKVDIRAFQGEARKEYPFLAGHEGAGIVSEVGKGVEGFSPGDKVTLLGGGHFAKFALVRTAQVAKIPQEVNDFEHWISEPVACATNGMLHSEIVPGDRIVIIGTGFMGLLLVQGLAHSPFGELIALDIDDSRLRLAAEFGAEEILNPASAEDHSRIEELKEREADLVIDASGAAEALDLATQLVCRAGRLVLFGWHYGMRSVDAKLWHTKGLRVANPSPAINPRFSDIFKRAVRLMRRRVFDLRPLITHALPPERAQELFEIAAEKKDGYIKGVLIYPS